MCLIISKYTGKKIAKKDIIVYKALKTRITVNGPQLGGIYFGDFIYEIDKLHKTDIKFVNSDCCFDNTDDRSLDLKWGEDWRKLPNIWKSIGPGFHSAKTLERLKDQVFSIFECVIPAGSEYYVNFNDLLVSNQIIVKKKLGYWEYISYNNYKFRENE